MRSRLRTFKGLLHVYFVIICWATIVFNLGSLNPSYAQLGSTSRAVEMESYLERPDILTAEARAYELGADWESLKAAQFSFVAELLALYPKGTDIYFLARDSEYLYDIAKLATQGTADEGRIHLINVSRSNMKSRWLEKYLEENGISYEQLVRGKKIVLVDTGFSGSISETIGKKFPERLRSQIRTHLIVSFSSKHPSSRAFLVHLNPKVNELTSASFESSILSYERLPRMTGRSTEFAYRNGQYHPMSSVNGDSDGVVSKVESLKHLKDLKSEWLKEETQFKFYAQKAQTEEFLEMLGSDNKQEIIETLEKAPTISDRRLMEATLRDILEARHNIGLDTNIKYSDLGFIVHKEEASPVITKKEFYLRKYPEWSKYILFPDLEIPKLVKEGNWLMIGNLIDANIDMVINKHLVESLLDEPASGMKKKMQILLLDKSDPKTKEFIASHIFSKPQSVELRDMLRILIEKSNKMVINILATSVFSQPHSALWPDLLQQALIRSDRESLELFISYTFSQAFSKDMREQLRLILNRADAEMLSMIIKEVFTKPHAGEFTELFKQVVAGKLTTEHRKLLEKEVFMTSHGQQWKQWLAHHEEANGRTCFGVFN